MLHCQHCLCCTTVPLPAALDAAVPPWLLWHTNTSAAPVAAGLPGQLSLTGQPLQQAREGHLQTSHLHTSNFALAVCRIGMNRRWSIVLAFAFRRSTCFFLSWGSTKDGML